MSDRTVICEYDPCEHDVDPDHPAWPLYPNQGHLYDDMKECAGSSLVPVVPDYDAANIALLSPAVVKATGVSMSYNQAKAIVRVVLTAAGNGDDEESFVSQLVKGQRKIAGIGDETDYETHTLMQGGERRQR